MDRFLVTVLLLASVIGPMTCASDPQNSTNGPPEPPKPHTTPDTPTNDTTTSPKPPITTSKPSTTTTPAPITTQSTTTPAPIPTNATTIAPTTKPTTPSPKPSSSTTTPAPHPPTPAPSDRKFEAFSFIGGFALAIGLVAIGFLAWKLYISRRENVYHTL